MPKWVTKWNCSGGISHESSSSHTSWLPAPSGKRKRRGLVEPREDDVAGLSQRLRRVRLVFIPRAVLLLIGLAGEGVRRSGDLESPPAPHHHPSTRCAVKRFDAS